MRSKPLGGIINRDRNSSAQRSHPNSYPFHLSAHLVH